VVGGIQVIVLNVLVLVMTLYQRTDLNTTVISRLYGEQSEGSDDGKTYRPKNWTVLKAWVADIFTCCCPCRREWKWYKRHKNILDKYTQARNTMRKELDIVLLIKQLRMLRILSLKQFT